MTTPTGPVVATASVAITPTTTAFNQQLRASLESAQRAVSDAADQMGDSIARQLTSGAARARLALEAMTAGLDERINVTVDVSRSLVSGLEKVGGGATKAGAAIGGLGLVAGNAAFALGSLLGAASQLSGIVIGLPAVVGAAALALGTLKLAVSGVSDAIGAGLTGDTEKFQAALEKLSPAAREFANDLVSFKSRFDDLKKATQQNFFGQFAGDAGKFMQNIIPIGEKGLPRISTELGKITDEFLKTSNSSGTLFKGIQSLVDATVAGLQRWKGVMGEVSNALGNLFQVGSGFATDMIGGIGQLIARFAEWINTAAQTGELQARFQAAIDAVAQLGRIIGNVMDIFGAFFFSAEEAGANFLGVLENITAKLATFLNSDAGIESLSSLMETASVAAAILGDAIGGLLPIVGQLVMAFSGALTDALVNLKPSLDALIEGVALFAQNASGGIVDAIGMIGQALGVLMNALTPILPVLGEIVGMLAEHFAVVIQLAASVIADFLVALQPFLPQIQALIENGLQIFTDALMAILDAVTPLMPVLIELAVNVLQTLADAFLTIFNVIKPFLPQLTELATTVIQMVADHFVTLFQAIQPLAPIIVELIRTGLDIMAQIFPVIVDAIKPLLPIIAETAKQFIKALAPVLPVIAQAFKDIFKALAPVLPQLAQLAGDILVTGAKLFTELVKAIAPLLPPLIEIATTILSALMPSFNKLLEAIIPLIPVLGDLALRILQDALIPILNALLPILPTLIDAFIKLLPSIIDILVPLTDLVIQLTPLITLFIQLADILIKVVAPAIVLVLTVINELRAIGLTLLGAALDALKLAFEIVWDAIVTAVKVAWDILSGIFQVIIDLLHGDFSKAWTDLKDTVVNVFTDIYNFAKETLDNILSFITEWGGKIWKAFWDALESVAGVFGTWFENIVKGVRTKIEEMITNVVGISLQVALAFVDAGKWLYEKGKDIIQGLINGLVEKAKELYDKIQGIIDTAKNLWDKATGWAFGSPSKWTTQRGKWIVEGFANGIEDKQNLAVNATQGLIDATKSPFESSFTASVPNLSQMLGSAAVAAPGTTAGGTVQSTGVTFGPGAVIVSFEGVIPSEADALRTGQAVGRGISDVLAERDARLAVRVL